MSVKKTNQQFIDEVFALHGNEYSVLEEYKGNRIPIKIRHNVCGRVSKFSPSNFLQGHGCNYCAQIDRDRKRRLSNKSFIKKVKDLVGDEYTFLDPYGNNAHEPLRVRHNTCGSVYRVRPYNFLYNNRRCPICNTSIGEQLIKKFLLDNHISFRQQMTFEGCLDIHKLSYDFYLPDNNVLIEYQGIQHYKPIGFFTAEYFSTQQKHDKIKRDFAKNNNINLLEIPYTCKTKCEVENMLKSYLNV